MIKKFSEYKVNESSEETMHSIELILGDWGGDGHNITHRIRILSNLTTSEIRNAFNDGKKTMNYKGGKGIDNYCNDYEDREIPIDFAEFCEDAFYGSGDEYPFKAEDIEEWNWISEGDKNVSINMEEYTDIYLRTVKLGNPNFKYQYSKSGSSMGIGGYGLFYT